MRRERGAAGRFVGSPWSQFVSRAFRGAIVSALIVGALVPLTAATAAADTFPPASKSWYVTDYSTSGWYSRGCTLGNAALQKWQQGSSAYQHTAVILDFGTEIKSGSTWGTEWTDLDGIFHAYTQAQAVIDEYAHGFWYCTGADTTATVVIGAGTRNIFWTGAARSTEGLAWAQLVVTFQNSLGVYASQASVFGAIDAEPAWSTPTEATDWGTGYSNAGGRQPYYDYGAASGCPPYGSCNNGWSQSSEYSMAWGIAAARAIPEIYAEDGSNATQWQQISLWGYNYGTYGKILFDASLTQYNACHSSDTRLAWCTSHHVDNSPLDGWTQLTSRLNSDARTASSVPKTTDVDWH